MSRLAKNPIPVPQGVELTLDGQDLTAKGPKGSLSLRVHDDVGVALEDAETGKVVKLELLSQRPESKPLWGTMWSRVRGMMHGVKDGYTKNLEIHGVGYRANLQGRTLVLQLGYSHDVNYDIPEGIVIAVEKQTQLAVSGIDKQRVGQVAAEIIAFRPPEPYKGKGIRIAGAHILRKEGKKK